MLKKLQSIAMMALVATMVSGCLTTSRDKGAAIGAVTGAAVGSLFGGGKGQLVGVAVGTVLGLITGSEVGRSIDERGGAYYVPPAQAAPVTVAPVGPPPVVYSQPQPPVVYQQGHQYAEQPPWNCHESHSTSGGYNAYCNRNTQRSHPPGFLGFGWR